MKKTLALVLSIILLVCSAAVYAEGVQTRERVIMIEGTEEIIAESLYESPQGFRIWYPADLFVASHEEGNDYFNSAVEGVDMGIAIVNGQMSYEAADEELAANIELSLANGGEVIGDIEEWTLESGLIVKHANIIFGDAYNPLYYVYGGGGVFFISCYYPEEAAEGFGTRIEEIISSFELTAE